MGSWLRVLEVEAVHRMRSPFLGKREGVFIESELGGALERMCGRQPLK